MHRFLTLMAVLVLVGCPPLPGPSPIPYDATDAQVAAFEAAPPPPPVMGDKCDQAYQHLKSLQCEPLKPATGTWSDVCRTDRELGVFPLKCINNAKSHTQALQCVSCVSE